VDGGGERSLGIAQFTLPIDEIEADSPGPLGAQPVASLASSGIGFFRSAWASCS